MHGRRLREEREASLVTRVRRDLERAEAIAKDQNIPKDVRLRLERMRKLSVLVEKSLLAFVKTARLDVLGAFQILAGK